MSENTQKERSIGALWLKESSQGQFFSGQIEMPDGTKKSIVVFPNSFKTEGKHPDFKIFPARDQGAARHEAPPQPATPRTDTPPAYNDNDAPPDVEREMPQ